MGYYPIKCIRCARELTNAEVLFDTKNTIIEMEGILKPVETSSPTEEKTKESLFENTKTKKTSSSIGWDDDDDDDDDNADNSEENGTTEAAVQFEDFMSCDAIERYAEQNDLQFERRYQKVNVTRDFAHVSHGDENLLIGIKYQTSKGGQTVRALKRYCPHCKSEIPTLSGSMPTYNVTVMGTSASGKTVYLTSLNWILSRSQGNLPYQSTLTCISANKANEDFVGKTNEMFSKGVLPATTQIILTEPLVVQMTYSLKNSTKKCLLVLADMRGEDLTSTEGDNLNRRGEFFARADAFMILVSPLNMPNVCDNIQSQGDEGESAFIHQQLMGNLGQFVLPFFDDGKITAPTVIMMSKCDVLMNNAQRLGIPPSNAVVAVEPPVKFTGSYFRTQHRGSQEIMNRFDRTLFDYFNVSCSKKYFTSFSSFGRNVNIDLDENGNKFIKNPNAIKPIRVIDPIIYILICLGFLPDFSKMEVGNQYNNSNIEILTRWIEERT